MPSITAAVTAQTDTVCPVCWESIHGDKPVGVTTGCGHIWHQDCYRSWQCQGEFVYESQSSAENKFYTLNSNLNCLICKQPTQSFVELFVRLPAVKQSHKEMVTNLEHQFNTVSRRTQLSLEKEIARRKFEQTWLQEERQLSQAARQRADKRHEAAIQALKYSLQELKINYERKRKNLDGRQGLKRNSSSSHGGSHSVSGSVGILQFQPGLADLMGSNYQSLSFSALDPTDLIDMNYQSLINFSALDAGGSDETTSDGQTSFSESETMATAPAAVSVSLADYLNRNQDAESEQASDLAVATLTNTSNETHLQDQRSLLASVENTDDSTREPDEALAASSTLEDGEEETVVNNVPDRQCRSDRDAPRENMLQPGESRQTPSFLTNSPRSSGSVSRDEALPPVAAFAAAMNQALAAATEEHIDNPTTSRKRKGSSANYLPSTYREEAATESATIISDAAEYSYERNRLEAESAYYQHQAELVEMERHQAEIELEQDELSLQQREREISMERSRLELSFSSMQRRVQETKQEARDRQKLTVMEEKFVKYKIARSKEEERYEQELEHLKQDEVHIRDREMCEKERQEAEKVRLRKELNQLMKVMNELESAKTLAKLAEEQSSASQSFETCVVCFEPLVNCESELGVVECGHTFHSECWDRWEKSRRRQESSCIPCPLCNVAISNVCVTMRFGSSIYCTSNSSLAKHFQKEEGRWQRRRLTGLGFVGEASS